MRTRLALLLAGMSTLIAVVAGCGAPKSGGFTAIDRSRIPAPLSATTTTSTTTTTTIPATTTTIEEPAATTTTIFVPPTTTIPSTLVRLYYVIGRDGIVSITRPVAGEGSVNQVMTLLESAPTGDGTDGLRTALPPGEKPNASDNGRGLVTVDVSSTFFENAAEDQRLAIAQIVLTFTQLGGISQVTFTQDGEPTKVIVADGTLSEEGAILYGKDFETLLDSAPPTTPPPTTTIAEPTTGPVTADGATTSVPVEQPTTLPSG